jgi:predicted nucleic acid-binding protein
LRIYEQRIRSKFEWVPTSEADWLIAAQFWADTVTKGKQLSDVDLLVAAVATRLDGIIVSADDDFNTLPIGRENWRIL